MASNLLLSVQDGYITYGKTPLFEKLYFNIHEGSRICLVGKNGAGKTTLMNTITGERELDDGERWQAPGVTIGYLHQEVDFNPQQNVMGFVLSGLSKDKQTEDSHYLVDMFITPLQLDPNQKMGVLSGGQLRRAALAKALVESPDILLLDEPTNHLDLAGIEWLENYLRNYGGTLLCISHDKTFLANISNKVFWLDRGKIRVCPKGFGHFEEWSTMLLEQEARELHNRSAAMALEIEWATKGIKARRKRNVRRVEEIKIAREKLKMDKSLFNKTMAKVSLAPMEASQSSRIIARFHNVSKSFGDKAIIKDFNLRIMRGDRIGLLGYNGSGKTTFLKLLLKEIEPDCGNVKLAKNIEISYFDQKREDLNPKHSLKKNLCPGGGDYVEVGGKQRHVCGYLKDFMFDPKDANNSVSTLSGGQRNRLMLAKVLAKPGNVLILDEPTNDLDMETLDMLEEIISKYNGTLIVVSHDRDFLDQTITKVLAFEGNAQVDGYIGGYSDYLEASGKSKPKKVKENKVKKKDIILKQTAEPPAKKKFTYTMQHELKNLPSEIEKIEQEISSYEEKLANPNFYMEDPEGFDSVSRKHAKAKTTLTKLEERWLELDELKES